LRTRFDRIFRRRTGFAVLDRMPGAIMVVHRAIIAMSCAGEPHHPNSMPTTRP
jgi:hypothetical protein